MQAWLDAERVVPLPVRETSEVPAIVANAFRELGIGVSVRATDILLGLAITVIGHLIAAAMLPALTRVTAARLRRLPRLDLSYFSFCNLVWLTAWLGLYEVRMTRELLGNSIGVPSRTSLGTLIALHYLLGGLDRWRRKMDPYSRSAPFFAALSAAALTIWRGSAYGAVLAFLTVVLFLIGYFRSNSYGRHWFGIPMFLAALAGCLAIAFGLPGLGEPYLVLAGIIAAARSITAVLMGIEDRSPPSPPPGRTNHPTHRIPREPETRRPTTLGPVICGQGVPRRRVTEALGG